MDTKKKIVMRLLVALWTLICVQATLSSQNVEKIQFCSSEYGDASDSITLKFNILDEKGEHVKNVRISSLYDHLQIYEEGKDRDQACRRILRYGRRYHRQGRIR